MNCACALSLARVQSSRVGLSGRAHIFHVHISMRTTTTSTAIAISTCIMYSVHMRFYWFAHVPNIYLRFQSLMCVCVSVCVQQRHPGVPMRTHARRAHMLHGNAFNRSRMNIHIIYVHLHTNNASHMEYGIFYVSALVAVCECALACRLFDRNTLVCVCVRGARPRPSCSTCAPIILLFMIIIM